MKKLGFGCLCLMLVGLVAGGSLADVPENFDLSGSIDAPSAYRSKEINTFHNGVGHTHSDFVLAPLITLNAKWETSDEVDVFVQFENRRLDAGNGTAANVDFGGGDNIGLDIEQAYIKVKEFLSEKITFTYGIQDLKLTLRKGDGAFFMDVAESTTASTWQALDKKVATRATTFRDTTEFSGFCFNYGSLLDDNYAVDVFWGVTEETGVLRMNDKLFGVNFSYKLPETPCVIKALLAQVSNTGAGMDIMTIGGGVVYERLGIENLSVYAEAYSQSGTLSKNGVDAAGNPTDVDQKAMAYRLGGRYDFAHDLKPYVDLSMWDLSGGDDSDDYKTIAAPKPANYYTENEHFVSYENSQSTMILEGHLLGLDLDSNYNAIKVEAGIKTSFDINKDGKAEPVTVKLLIGQFKLKAEPYVTNSGPNKILDGGGDDVTKKADDGLGMEIDITMTLDYTENLSFTIGLGMLTGSDFFDSIDIDDPGVGATDFDTETFDSMTMFIFSAGIKF